jgi:hypothetical protein
MYIHIPTLYITSECFDVAGPASVHVVSNIREAWERVSATTETRVRWFDIVVNVVLTTTTSRWRAIQP